MTKKELNKKEAVVTIGNKLSEGIDRQQILEELSEMYYDKSTIAKLIAMTPSEETKSKFKTANNTLLGLLTVTIIFKVVLGIILMANISIYAIPVAFLMPILSILFAFEVYKYRGYIYNILGLLSIVGLMKTFQNMESFGILELLDLGIIISICGLAFYLGKNMFPNYGFFGPKKDDQGNVLLS